MMKLTQSKSAYEKASAIAVSALKSYSGAIPDKEIAHKMYSPMQSIVEFLTAAGIDLAGLLASGESVVMKSKPR